MKKYTYDYVYCTCNSMYVGTTSNGTPLYIGNGRINFFTCIAKDILEADKLLEQSNNSKINWNKYPWTQVVCSFEEIINAATDKTKTF